MEWFTAAERFTTALASSDPTPGGGAAAAHAGAMGCALAIMATGITLKRKSTPAAARTQLEPSLKRLQSLKKQLSLSVQKDAQAYSAYITACKLSKEDPSRPQAVQEALFFAASIPADIAKTAVEALKEIETVKHYIADTIFSDIVCAKYLLQTCVRCAIENIRVNLVFIKNEDTRNSLEKQIAVFQKSC